MTDYRQILDHLPDLAAHLAAAVVGSAPQADGMPHAQNVNDSPWTSQLDELDAIVTFLVESIDHWDRATTGWEVIAPRDVQAAGVARGIDGFRYTRVVTDDPLAAAYDVARLVGILYTHWDQMVALPWAFQRWTDSMHTAGIIARVHSLEGRGTGDPLRRCPVCDRMTLRPDLTHDRAVCHDCEKVIAPPRVWMTIADAAAHLGVSTRTIRRWIAGGDVTPTRDGRRVDVRECREHRDAARARALLNLPNVHPRVVG